MKNNKIGVFIYKNDNIYNPRIKKLPLLGIIDGNNIYKWISYNKFEKEPTPIPKNYKKIDIPKDILFMFQGIGNKINKIEYKNSKKYILYTIGTAYDNKLVFTTKNNIYIHKKKIEYDSYYYIFLEKFWKKDNSKYILDDDKINNNSSIDKSIFYDKSCFYQINDYKKIFIGKDLGKYNSILIQKTKSKYIFICNDIIEFNVLNNDKIIKYISIYTNGRLYPDPIAIGKKYIYVPTFKSCINKKNLPKELFKKSDKDFFDNLIQLVIHGNIEEEKVKIFIDLKI
jgi:hypothetical protein